MIFVHASAYDTSVMKSHPKDFEGYRVCTESDPEETRAQSLVRDGHSFVGWPAQSCLTMFFES